MRRPPMAGAQRSASFALHVILLCRTSVLAGLCLAATAAFPAGAESTCFGTVSSGRLEGGIELPSAGKNFTGYSALGSSIGRTYVHSKVPEIVVAAYAALERTAPDKVFVYGETGRAARYEGHVIDFVEAIAEHLYQLHTVARARGAGIALVIFDPPYLCSPDHS